MYSFFQMVNKLNIRITSRPENWYVNTADTLDETLTEPESATGSKTMQMNWSKRYNSTEYTLFGWYNGNVYKVLQTT